MWWWWRWSLLSQPPLTSAVGHNGQGRAGQGYGRSVWQDSWGQPWVPGREQRQAWGQAVIPEVQPRVRPLPTSWGQGHHGQHQHSSGLVLG